MEDLKNRNAQRNDSLITATESVRRMANEVVREIRATPNGQRPFFDTWAFNWVREVELEWQVIRSELDRLLTALDYLPGFEDIQIEQQSLTQDKRWKVFPLFIYGQWFEKNNSRCSETSRIIKKIPGLQAAMFSVLQSKKVLEPHLGNYCGVLRYHLGMKVPKPEALCGIKVGGINAQWKEGQSLIFDDTYIHSAWNLSQENRVVLFVDFTRPLPLALDKRNVQIIESIGKSGFIEDTGSRWDQWEDIYGEQLDRLIGGMSP